MLLLERSFFGAIFIDDFGFLDKIELSSIYFFERMIYIDALASVSIITFCVIFSILIDIVDIYLDPDLVFDKIIIGLDPDLYKRVFIK